MVTLCSPYKLKCANLTDTLSSSILFLRWLHFLGQNNTNTRSSSWDQLRPHSSALLSPRTIDHSECNHIDLESRSPHGLGGSGSQLSNMKSFVEILGRQKLKF